MSGAPVRLELALRTTPPKDAAGVTGTVGQGMDVMALARSFMIGVVAGMRTMTAPCAVSWAIAAGRLNARHYAGVAPLLTALALGEYVADTLPMTGSRTGTAQFGARLVSGGLCGVALRAAQHEPASGLLAGVCGASVGTIGGAAARTSLARALGRDLPAALIEDALAITTAAALVLSLPGPTQLRNRSSQTRK